MLFYLKYLSPIFGPFRMMGSHMVLLCTGAILAALATWFFLPRLWNRLPRDKGKALAPGGHVSAGKPTGAGKYILWITLPVLFLVLPFSFERIIDYVTQFARVHLYLLVNQQWCIVGCLFLAMLTGYFDDKAETPWGRKKKGALDAVVAILTALVLCRFQPMEIWVPGIQGTLTMSWYWYMLMAVPILWFTMNATNCSDGVDGLAGTLTLMSLFTFSVFLYGVVGHEDIAKYLLIPHNIEGAKWGILTATFGGAVAGYLWYNAEPSKVLMGDAGSRPLGLLVGVAALACGNPFLILVVAPIVIVNGGTGLLKILLLRVLAKLGMDIRNPATVEDAAHRPHPLVKRLHSVRFPLHDHCRKNKHWSNAQVLMRFVLIQALLTPILFLILVKVR